MVADIETIRTGMGRRERERGLGRESKVQKRCREERKEEEREGQGKKREEELFGLLQHQASLRFLFKSRIST